MGLKAKPLSISTQVLDQQQRRVTSLPAVDLSLALLQQISTQCSTKDLDLLQHNYNKNGKGRKEKRKLMICVQSKNQALHAAIC